MIENPLPQPPSYAALKQLLPNANPGNQEPAWLVEPPGWPEPVSILGHLVLVECPVLSEQLVLHTGQCTSLVFEAGTAETLPDICFLPYVSLLGLVGR